MTDFDNQNKGRRTASIPRLPATSLDISQETTPHQPYQLSSASSYADLHYLFGVQDPAMIAPKPAGNRRKSEKGPDHAKHRRTRSGCYTCRSRRVKCDEAHPVCERCKKGGRDCVYPEPTTSSKSNSASKSAPVTNVEEGSSSDDYEDDAVVERTNLTTIVDEDEAHDIVPPSGPPSTSGTHSIHTSVSTAGPPRVPTRQNSETPSLVQDKGSSPTPSTEGSVGYTSYQTAGSTRLNQNSISSSSSGLLSDWSHLPPDLQFYMTYFLENVTYLHYSLKFDAGNFLKTHFIDAALRNEALLYAVVGFAAFQWTLHNPDGKMQFFLQYYNKAVSLLLKSLKKGERHNIGTILAILQLATIEEFLGDWINLLGHQKAAFQMITGLYNPQTVLENDTTRIILSWYMRFDVFAGLMGGFETVLSREWFSSCYDFFQQQTYRDPTNLNWKIEHAVASLRLIATDMSTVFARMGKGESTFEQFAIDNEAVGRRIDAWKSEMDPALQDERYLVFDFSGARPLDPNDIVNPYLPGKIYQGALWTMNISIIDWYAIALMHKYQTALTTKMQPSPQLAMDAFDVCQLFESVEYFPGSPPGTILAMQASLGIAALFLPRDERHTMWARRKLATIESQGYIYPYTFRTKMSDLFRDRSCMHWWLPNDENYPPIIRSIRKFVEERTSKATDLAGEDLRDMKAVFSSLNLDDNDPNLNKGGEHPVELATIAGEQEWAPSAVGTNPMPAIGEMAQNGSSSYGFNDTQEYWSGDQQSHSYSLPGSERYP